MTIHRWNGGYAVFDGDLPVMVGFATYSAALAWIIAQGCMELPRAA